MGPGRAAPGLGAAELSRAAAPGLGAADFVESFLVAPPLAAGKDSRSRRATGASTVDDADLTNSPCSLRRSSTCLLVTPSSLASSCTRALPATALLTWRPSGLPATASDYVRYVLIVVTSRCAHVFCYLFWPVRAALVRAASRAGVQHFFEVGLVYDQSRTPQRPGKRVASNRGGHAVRHRMQPSTSPRHGLRGVDRDPRAARAGDDDDTDQICDAGSLPTSQTHTDRTLRRMTLGRIVPRTGPVTTIGSVSTGGGRPHSRDHRSV